MSDLVTTTMQLYRDALRATGRSLMRGWLTIIAVVAFAIVLALAARIAAPLGIAGGFLLGAVNALLVGATLSLIEQSLRGTRTLTVRDVAQSVGHYFWDVIGVGFVLWLPLMALDMGLRANPYGQFLLYAVMLLLFILLNPAPEIIYQVRHDSPLDVFKSSYEFVLENWIEWFLPFAVLLIPILLAPFGLRSFFDLASRLGRGAGLDFFQILVLPFTMLGGWLAYLGIPPEAASLFILVMTPPLAVAMLLFRGHLFALLHGSSRRQRLFKSKFGGLGS